MLATEWTVAEDGKEVTFTLRDDVTFNDGSAFDAETVKANFERAKSIEGSMVLPALETVDSVEVVSPTEVKFVLHTSNPALPARSAARRVGQECVRTCRSRGSPVHLKKKDNEGAFAIYLD